MKEVPADMTGITVEGNGSDNLSIVCEFAIDGTLIAAARQRIQESELDVKLKTDSSGDGGVLTLLVGAVKAAAYAIINLAFEIIDIITSKRPVRAS